MIVLCLGGLLALPGCGGGDDEGRPIPAQPANRMIALIGLADRQSADGTCSGAADKVREAQKVLADDVPNSVDADVRRGISDGLDRLLALIQQQCEKPQDTETTPTQTTTTVTETQTTPTQTTPTQTTPTTTTPTDTTPTGTTPTGTTPTDTTTTGTGGTPPAGAVGGAGGAGSGE